MSDPYGPVPSAPTQAGQKPARPAPLNAAFWLYLASIVVGLVSTFVGLPAVAAAAELAARQVSTRGIPSGSVVTVAVTVAAVAGVLGALLWVLFLIFLRLDQGWSRWVLGALTVLGLGSILAAYGLGALHEVLAIVATVLVFLPASTAYLREAAARRRLARGGPATGV
jgi:hypothetical protein